MPAGASEHDCAPGLTETEVRVIKETIEIRAASVAVGDYAKWLSCFADGAVLMPAGHESVEGRAAIDAFVRGEVGPLSSYTFTDWHFEGATGLAVVTSN